MWWRYSAVSTVDFWFSFCRRRVNWSIPSIPIILPSKNVSNHLNPIGFIPVEAVYPISWWPTLVSYTLVRERFVVITAVIVCLTSIHCNYPLSPLISISDSIPFSDCPFEEHVSFYPLCDYMICKRGLPYVKRILQESTQSIPSKSFFLSSDIRTMFF